MRILKANIIRTARNRGFVLQSIDAVKTYYARPVFSKWDPADLLYKDAIVLQLGQQYSLLGFASNLGNRYIEYQAGPNLVLRNYDNDNLVIYPQRKGTLGISVLNFEIKNTKLIFDSSTLCIPTHNLPASYLIEVDNHYTTISILISAGNFSNHSGVPRESLRRWRITGKLLPQKVDKNSYAYYGNDQITLAKALASKRSSSAIIYKTIMDAIGKIKPGEVRHLTWFKNLIPGYDSSTYKSLNNVLQKLLAEDHLKRIKRGYYAVIPENKK